MIIIIIINRTCFVEIKEKARGEIHEYNTKLEFEKQKYHFEWRNKGIENKKNIIFALIFPLTWEYPFLCWFICFVRMWNKYKWKWKHSNSWRELQFLFIENWWAFGELHWLGDYKELLWLLRIDQMDKMWYFLLAVNEVFIENYFESLEWEEYLLNMDRF